MVYRILCKKLALFILVGFGLAYATELIPFLRKYIEYAMVVTLILLSFLIEREQHVQDDTLRYLAADIAVDVFASLGARKILDILSEAYEFVPTNTYLQFAIMLSVAALISSLYNSCPSDGDGD